MFDVTAIGNPVYDIIITPYVKTDGRVLSGCSTNAALTVGKLGGRAALIGKIGNDFIEDFISVAKNYGVTPYPLISRETGGFYLRYIDDRMNDRELRVLGIADKIDFSEVPKEALDSKSIVIGPILKEISLRFVKSLVEENDDSLIIVDPQGLIREIINGKVTRVPNKETYEVIKLTHITKPNEHEAEVLFPGMDMPRIARKIFRLNNFAGIVTVADKGSFIAFNKGIYHVPAYRTVERDPTGCGDVYAGAFAYYYIKHQDLLESAIFASAAASFMVESTGPNFSINLKNVMERFESLQEHVKKVSLS